MAKSANYFGLRKGSTKSHTFSVVDGKQITKDRVEGCKNFDDICTIALIYSEEKRQLRLRRSTLHLQARCIGTGILPC